MNWTQETLEAAVGQYLRFPDGSSRLLQRSGKGYRIGQSRQTVSTKVALQILAHHEVQLANPRIHV